MAERLEFLREIPMDKAHSLDQMTSRFRTVRDGLPELVKNAKDQYSRLGVLGRDQRQIVVIADSSRKSLGVLDFAGAEEADFSGWQTWSSRTASRAHLARDIEAGHGNGGKSFMVRGCTQFAFMDSCDNGRRTRMGFDNSALKNRYIPGFAKRDGTTLRNIEEPNSRERLDEALSEIGISYETLPDAAKSLFDARTSFTLVSLNGVKDWESKWKKSIKKLVRAIAVDLCTHAQAALSVETCSVWIVADGRLAHDAPLTVVHPEPFPGFEDLQAIPVPDELPDPNDDQPVSTGPGGPKDKYLSLMTSDRHLRMTDDRKALNVIRVRNDRNIVANWGVATLAPRAETSFIYGDLYVSALTEDHLADSHRSQLADDLPPIYVPIVTRVQCVPE